MIRAIPTTKGISMPKTAFASDTKSVGALLISNQPDRVVVPTFQRGYSWQKEHVKEFWDDLTGENASQYFLGPIVIMHQDGGVIELLDGQQRLATATILLSVLRDIAQSLNTTEAGDFAAYLQRDFIIGENRVRRIQLGELDDLYFHDTIQLREPTDRKPTLATHRHIKAARTYLFDMVTRYDSATRANGPQADIGYTSAHQSRTHISFRYGNWRYQWEEFRRCPRTPDQA